MDKTAVLKKIRDLANIPLNAVGAELTKRGANPSVFERLKRMARLGFSPSVIFDCGAYLGNWTVQASKLFPGAQFLLVEPNKKIVSETEGAVAAIDPQPVLVEAAIGEGTGSVYLNVWGNEHTSLAGSSLLSHVQGTATERIESDLMTLDDIAEKYKLTPDLIKLDLQGAERAALNGGQHVLVSAELVIVEFGCLEAYVDRTSPRELMDIMYSNDYCLYDVVDLIYRPYDGALTGGDFFFIKNDSPLRIYKGFK